MSRVYLPTLAELIDRLCICQLKSIFISEHKAEYDKEIGLIMHDIDTILQEGKYQEKIGSEVIRAMCVLMLSNRAIWESESKARAGGDTDDKNLKYSHSLNGVRNTAKNIIAGVYGERKDYKIDCWSASLDKNLFGNWDVFKTEKA